MGFFYELLATPLRSADTAVAAKYFTLEEWWRLVSTNFTDNTS